MANYFVTSTLGAGKTLISVSKIVDYIERGRKIATNLDLFFENYPLNSKKKAIDVVRLPDHPSAEDIDFIGYGNTSADESKNGLLVLDECGTWLNSHDYQAKGRKAFVNKMLHLRKLGWDGIFIVQDFEMVDKQIRKSLGEHVVYCRRTDRINIPLLSPLLKLFTGYTMPLPRIHIGAVRYGYAANALVIDRWIYRGTSLFDFYDTKQIFDPEYSHGIYSYVPPKVLNSTKEANEKLKSVKRSRLKQRINSLRPPKQLFFIAGLLLSGTVSSIFSSESVDVIEKVNATESIKEEGDQTDIFENVYYTGSFIYGSYRKVFLSKLIDDDLIPISPQQLGAQILSINNDIVVFQVGDKNRVLRRSDYQNILARLDLGISSEL